VGEHGEAEGLLRVGVHAVGVGGADGDGGDGLGQQAHEGGVPAAPAGGDEDVRPVPGEDEPLEGVGDRERTVKAVAVASRSSGVPPVATSSSTAAAPNRSRPVDFGGGRSK
jgi:hypothetical protein